MASVRETLEGLRATCRHTGLAAEEEALAFVLGPMLPESLRHLLERASRQCGRCGKPIQDRPRAEYCGETCRQAAFRARTTKQDKEPKAKARPCRCRDRGGRRT